jgi:peptidoglycan-associated lipoprotein
VTPRRRNSLRHARVKVSRDGVIDASFFYRQVTIHIREDAPMISPRTRAAILALTALAGLSLAACATKPKPAPVAAAPAPPPPPPPAPPPPEPTPAPPPPAPTGPVPGSTQDFVINAGDLVYFDYDKVLVRDDAKSVLDAQANWLQRYPAVHVRIEGNCDERGTREYNFALGSRRATAVRDYLVGKGLSPTRVETISYGKEKPVDTGTGEEAWGHNRNGHTVITQGAQ